MLSGFYRLGGSKAFFVENKGIFQGGNEGISGENRRFQEETGGKKVVEFQGKSTGVN